MLTYDEAIDYVLQLSCDGIGPSAVDYDQERAVDWPAVDEILEATGYSSWGVLLAALNLESDSFEWSDGGFATNRNGDVFYVRSNANLHYQIEMSEQEKYL